MNVLWIFYNQTYQQYTMRDSEPGTISIGNGQNHSITVGSLSFKNGFVEVRKQEGSEEYLIYDGEERIGILEKNKPLSLNLGNELFTIFLSSGLLQEHTYYVGNRQEITCSCEDGATIQKEAPSGLQNWRGDFSLIRQNDTWTLEAKGESRVYINGEQMNQTASLRNGDIVCWPFMMLSFMEDDLLVVRSLESYKTSLIETLPPISEMKKNYPLYRRTPRMIYELPDEKVTISFPSQENDDNQRGIWLIILPPLVMLLVMGIVAIIQPRGIFILVSLVMFLTTMVTSTVQYFKDKKNRKYRQERRHRVYTAYLEQKREELQELSDKQKQVLHYHYPSFEQMKSLAAIISDRIWERTMESEDFLHFRIGRADLPAHYEVAASSSDMSNREIDDLLEQSQELVNIYSTVESVPQTVDLSSGAIGLVGKESIVKNELQQVVGQLAFFHSYHDVRFIAIFNEADYKEWEWMKWLPHFQMPHSYAKGLVYNEQTRDQLLSSIYQTLKDRELDEAKGKVRFSPHFIFIISDHSLISEHVIMEYLEGKEEQIGISSIFATDTKESLTENIHTLVRYINEREGEILIQDRKAVHTSFSLDSHSKEGNERYSRLLRSLDHQKGMNNSIPDMVSFLQLHDAREVEELSIDRNWMNNKSSESLAVPIGLKGRKDIVELNLHEKAHGPHGLLAGTTGSGKSELLQTYILSLAVHFHPHEVAFLLIDYKGGGMAQPFKNIPHLLGTITNIEGSKNFSARALASINSELKKRQRLFDQYEVNHINDYTDLHKDGRAEEPLPHLFLISDEFAELKNEEPEFIRELVSAARIGRSLGVHLILATQKPGGIIDNQIWSNARFKIALKVQDANDSKEILKNSDAANITVTGRGYLQVGNNEAYELFQSAWSGAPYMEDTFGAEDEIAIVTDLGLVQISNVTAQTVGKKKEKQTEIDAVVQEIVKVQNDLSIPKLKSPWLPPLKERLSRMEAISGRKELYYIGLKDEPEKQSQSHYVYNWIEDGNIGIFGSSGYGKSSTVMTLLLHFAEQHSPDELHYYLFDFGNSALLPLRQLAHTGDYFRFDEHRKIEKFISFLKVEIERRKQLFTEKELSTIKLYNSLSEDKLPIIFIAIDNFDLVKEELQDIESQFTQFARDGQALGIFMIFTATRINAMRQPLMNNLKTKIIHYLMDSSESYSILGRTPFDNEPVPGRALIKKDETYLAQIYLPADGDDDIAVLENVKKQVASLNELYQGVKKPAAIPMLPARLDMPGFKQYIAQDYGAHLMPIGLEEESVLPVSIDIRANPHVVVLGQSRKGKTNVLKVMLDSLLAQQIGEIGIYDAVDRGLSSYAARENVKYVETKEQINEWLDHISSIFEEREKDYLQSIERSQIKQNPYEPILFVLDSISRFQQSADGKIQDRLTMLLKQYSHLGFSLIVAGNANEFMKGFDSFTNEVKQIRQAVLLMKKSEQSLFTLPYSRNEEEIQPGYGYYVQGGKESKIQIPLND
ncbi:type VII secretion protein EssC [Bacillus sp. CECT 9360]|uniref:type VII secretion protein EssC n=1 Tax=Bacillus sp. CECT 9360 TaxID=2845821 RepID=UPI001E58D23A|nr:type VII secretion protein EssC [Bacillus sp. CECT 9360]CAH0347673.1 ESX secretion system protein EccC [Bacillus sp. CECT 9360]